MESWGISNYVKKYPSLNFINVGIRGTFSLSDLYSLLITEILSEVERQQPRKPKV